MLIKPRLLTPGPTQAPPGVAEAMAAAASLHHRSEAFRALGRETSQRLGAFMLGTPPETPLSDHGLAEPVMLTGSGSVGLESVLVNLLNPGDRVFVIEAGRFGSRWAKMARDLGFDAHSLTLEWGEPCTPERLAEALESANQAARPFKLCCFAACETSTGALASVAELAAVAKAYHPECLSAVDGITWLGAHAARPAAMGVDALVFASQKALGVAPGLSALWLSKHAWNRAERVSTPRVSLDLRRERDAQASGSFDWTAPISLVAGLHAALGWVASLPEGTHSLIANAEQLSRATRAALEALELDLVAQRPAQSLSVFRVPRGADAELIRARLRERWGLQIAGGQEHLKGEVLRIAHLGYSDWSEHLSVLAALAAELDKPGGAALDAFMGELS